MTRGRFPILLVVTLAVGSLIACGGSPKGQARATPAVRGVTFETIHLQSLPNTYEAVGTVRSATTSLLGAQVSVVVQEVRIKPGDAVRRGQVLALLDDRASRARLAAAEAGIEASHEELAEVDHTLEAAAADRAFAEATYRRYKDLLAKNSVSRQEFDGVEARYRASTSQEAALSAKKKQVEAHGRQAHAEQASAETLLSYSRITSPIDGLVTARLVDPGTLVMSGTPLFTVEDTAHYRLEASLPEGLEGRVRTGQAATVATGHGTYEGKVVEIVPAADTSSRTFIAKLELPAHCSCRSGEYGSARFLLGQAKRLLVPRTALVEHGELEGLYVVDEGSVARYRLVKTGKSFGEQVEVLAGLTDGERVVIAQVDRLTDGARVEGQ